MTNDELLAMIKEIDNELNEQCDCDRETGWVCRICRYADRLLSALRAVVELHKPHGITAHTAGGREWIECSCEYEYPCPTIQAIEKELR